MPTNPTPDYYEKIFRQLGWLQPGQPLHEAQVPHHLLDRYPGAAALLQQQANVLSPESGGEIATPSVSTPESGPTGIPESETTDPPRKKRSRNHCRGLTKAGNACYAYKMWAGDLCVFHNAKAVNESQWHDAARQFDPETIAEAKTAAVDLDLLPVAIPDNASFLAVAEGILRMTTAGSIPERMVGPIIRILRLCQRALPDRHDARATPAEAEHVERVEQVIKAASTIRDRLDKQDIYRRDLDTEDAGRKREAILKANQKYAPPPNSNLQRRRSMLAY